MIQDLRLKYPIPLLSRMMNIAASGYYDWRSRPISKWAQREARLVVEIKAAHKRTRGTYGPERLQRDLAKHGTQVGICSIKRIRKQNGICCIQKKKFKRTTDSRHGLPVAENLLNQQFKVDKPNMVWLSDITYIPTDEGWLYLASHKDLFTHVLVGYAMGKWMTRNLISESLFKAIEAKRPKPGLLHHNDRGSQYCSDEYRQILDGLNIQVSMSRKGNCYDNAPMESFWGTLKQELIHHRHYATRQEAMREITEYIEVFYNRQRIQAELGYLSPAAFAQKYYAGLIAS
jgi:putative transposase